MFFVSNKQLKQCTCGTKTEIYQQDPNLFAESVNMDTLVKALDRIMVQAPDYGSLRKDSQLNAIIGKFFTSFKE